MPFPERDVALCRGGLIPEELKRKDLQLRAEGWHTLRVQDSMALGQEAGDAK